MPHRRSYPRHALDRLTPLPTPVDPRKRTVTLLEERTPAYSRSAMLITPEYRSAKDVANLILGQFRKVTTKAP